jgi:hypothetical protein
VILIQPDTVLPDEPWAAVFKARSNRVKATKLRGVWSFGIVLPVWGMFPIDVAASINVGDEVSGLLGVTKYEPPAPQDLSAAGFLPRDLPKTDEERWQNISDLPYGEVCDITLKIDGQSWSAYYKRIPMNLVFWDEQWNTSLNVITNILLSLAATALKISLRIIVSNITYHCVFAGSPMETAFKAEITILIANSLEVWQSLVSTF